MEMSQAKRHVGEGVWFQETPQSENTRRCTIRGAGEWLVWVRFDGEDHDQGATPEQLHFERPTPDYSDDLEGPDMRGLDGP